MDLKNFVADENHKVTPTCCICCISIRAKCNIFEEYIGQPAILISELISKCLHGSPVIKVEDTGGICRKCMEKLLRYYKAINIAREIRAELLELKKGPLVKNTRNVYAEITSQDHKPKNHHLLNECDAQALSSPPIKQEGQSDVMKFGENPYQGTVAAIEIVQALEDLQQYENEMEENVIEECIEDFGDEDLSDCRIDLNTEDIIVEDGEDEADEYNEHILLNDVENPEEDPNNTDVLYEVESALHSCDDESNYDALLLDQFKHQTLQESSTVGTAVQKQKRLKRIESSIIDYRKLQCEECNIVFSTNRQYRSHVKKIHFTGYVCDECGKTLTSASGFKIHIQNHNPVKQFACPTCGERYSNKMTLKHHMAWHTGEQNFECDVCQKRFVHRINMLKHRRIHDNSTRKLACDVCGFRFRNKPHLARHMMTHTKQKPHSCPHCGQCFAQLYNLRTHIREHENPGSTKQSRMRCKKCMKCFTSKKNYQAHCDKDDCVHKTEVS